MFPFPRPIWPNHLLCTCVTSFLKSFNGLVDTTSTPRQLGLFHQIPSPLALSVVSKNHGAAKLSTSF